jgi:hypothetical protein
MSYRFTHMTVQKPYLEALAPVIARLPKPAM